MDNPEKTRWWLRDDKALLLTVMTIALLTLAVYMPSLRNGYMYYDDNLYITMNQSITHLDIPFVRWAFTTFQVYNWQPLTWISYALDYALWGRDPFGYHLTNVILHAANTVLVMLLVARLFSAAWQRGSIGAYPPERMLITAGITGMLFGIHPLHVESVAWLGERKDALYAFFYLLTLPYVSYTRSQRLAVSGFVSIALAWRSLLVRLCFVLCLGTLLSVLLTALTVRQIRVWKDDITLWSREIEVYPYSVPIGYINRADAYSLRRGMTEQAIADYSIAVQVDSQNSEAYCKRGKLYYVTGRMRLAANNFAQALLFDPDFHEARYYKQVAEERLR